MSQLPLFDVSGKSLGEVNASDSVFAQEPNEQVVYDVLKWYQASKRRGTHSTKTRAEVRGGGKKPWRQKGTGRARAGSIRSPLWVKGGVAFGPKPRSYGYALPKKVRKLALKIVLSDKAKEGKLKVVEELKLPAMKTKEAKKLLKVLAISGKIVVLLAEDNELFRKAARNLPGVVILSCSELNIFDLLKSDWVVVEKKAIEKIEGVL